MHASEVEATRSVTLVGKGIFNSRVVAWGGMVAEHYEAVFRGGTIISHGRVHVREVGSHCLADATHPGTTRKRPHRSATCTPPHDAP